LPAAPSKAAPSARRTSGASLIAKLAKLGIRGDADLILHLPLRYEDETALTAIAAAVAGVPCQIEAEVVDSSVHLRPRRQLVCRVSDASGELVLRFFSFYPSQQKQLQPGARLRLFGEIRDGFWGAEMVHPRFRVVRAGEPLPTALTPIYPTTAGLSQAALRKLTDAALARTDLADTLPEALRLRLRLAPFADSVMTLHHPAPAESAAAFAARSREAWRRIKFDELLAQKLSLRLAYLARRARAAPVLAGDGSFTGKLLQRLPFRLTRAQQRAWGEIRGDLALPHPMQRLLQGDVGSGKTIVAALAMLQAVESGCQAALMAPTEILAEQHFRKLAAWLEPMGMAVAWLSGGLKKGEKAAMLGALASGQVRLAIGTHALIEEQVAFARLGLAIVDEQHRFGVRQRLALRKKGAASARDDAEAQMPHQLMMSATPIPRTLAMSYYADLDVSVLDELPPGRTPVLTKLASDTRRDEVIARVRDACAAGRQAYWVCPLIEESEALQLQTAIATFEQLKSELPGLAIGLVHGRLAAAEKSEVMAAFAAGRVQLLVATTVIEVGVDVPNASLMVIEHAERFGLAQLHQLRGRVGRGSAESVCILLYQNPLSEAARARLKVIYENTDGFEVARRDLELRGPGEFIGSRQSGVPLLRFADLGADEDLLALARQAAEDMLCGHPQQVQAHVARWLGARQELLRA
jgi:ATP-dependent DNA helicase RecG